MVIMENWKAIEGFEDYYEEATDLAAKLNADIPAKARPHYLQ